MKYTVLGFQQQKLMDNKLTLEDAFLLSVIKDMYASDRMESIIQDDKRYIWINQAYLLEQIPILGSMSKLKRMLNKLCEEGFLESILVTNKKGVAGRFYYVKYTSKLSDLEDYETKVQNDTRLEGTKVQNDTRPKFKMTLNQSSKRPNKDSSIKDSSINNSIMVDEVWNYYTDKLKAIGKTRKKTENKTKHINARLTDNFTVDQLKQVMDNVFSNDFMLGKNENNKMYIEIDNFMCNTEKVEKWLEVVKPKEVERKVEQKANCGAYKEWRGRKSAV